MNVVWEEMLGHAATGTYGATRHGWFHGLCMSPSGIDPWEVMMRLECM